MAKPYGKILGRNLKNSPKGFVRTFNHPTATATANAVQIGGGLVAGGAYIASKHSKKGRGARRHHG